MIQKSDGAEKLNLVFPNQGGAKYSLYRVFTTINGHWEIEDNVFSLPLWAFAYATPLFLERGAATHILVRVEKADGSPLVETVIFRNGNLTNALNTGDKPSGWQNQPIYNNKYDPDSGEHGAWSVQLPGADFGIEGVGLPYGWHVSTFIVYRLSVANQPPVVTPTVWPVQNIVLTQPTILRVSGAVPFTVEVNHA
jgi:hypothetical protein